MRLLSFKKIFDRFRVGFRAINPELIFWIGAMVYLFYIDPNASGHFDFCLWNRLGIDFCPGCGLGRAIGLLFDGDIIGSWQRHPLGIPAVIIIFIRIFRLTALTIKQLNLDTGGQNGRHFSASPGNSG